jgi:MaoC like domain
MVYTGAYDETVKTNPDFASSPQAPWSIVARNLPEHANNSIHTDEGARAAGFERALVAGVTSYGYCLHPVIHHFGLDWLATGEAEVRFRAPVFDGDYVSFPLTAIGDGNQRSDGHADPVEKTENGVEDGVEVEAWVDRSARPLVSVSAWRNHREQHPYPSGTPRAGEQLETVHLVLEGEYGSQYGQRSGNQEDPCAKAGLVHPGGLACPRELCLSPSACPRFVDPYPQHCSSVRCRCRRGRGRNFLNGH